MKSRTEWIFYACHVSYPGCYILNEASILAILVSVSADLCWALTHWERERANLSSTCSYVSRELIQRVDQVQAAIPYRHFKCNDYYWKNR